MKPFALALVPLLALVFTPPASGQQPGGGWSYPQIAPAAPPEPLPQVAEPPGGLAVVPRPDGFPTYTPERPAPPEALPPPPPENGQQHWVSLNLSVFQPFVGRIGVKVWPRPNNSVWLEAYLGSVLFDIMYGFGVRMQHTAYTFGSGGRLMVSPGVGVHLIPRWSTHGYFGGSNHGGIAYLAGDVDLSWLHDFTPHFGFELGVKLGLAGRLAGGERYSYPRGVMFGRDLYPILALYSGFRF
jgi:hypothetical protein